MPNILFIKGLLDDNWVQIFKKGKSTRYKLNGNCNIFTYFKSDEYQKEELIVDGIDSRRNYNVKHAPDIIFNEISDADSHTHALKNSQSCCDQLAKHFHCPVINQPSYIRYTTRDETASRLQNIPNFHVPKTIRCKILEPQDILTQAKQHGLTLPLLVRIAGRHQGDGLVLYRGEEDLKKLYALPFDGRDYYLIEFVDFKNNDGLYRKYRIVVINGEPFIRHVLIHDNWLIHAHVYQTDPSHAARNSENKTIIDGFDQQLKPLLTPITQAIFKRIPLEYFGMDISISDNGKVTLFESNANMNVFYNPYANDPESRSAGSIEKIWHAFGHLLKSKIAVHIS